MLEDSIDPVESHLVRSMLNQTPNCLSLLNHEDQGSVIIKVNWSEGEIIKRHQTKRLLSAGRRAQSTSAEDNVDFKSRFALVVTYIRLQGFCFNLNRRQSTSLFQ